MPEQNFKPSDLTVNICGKLQAVEQIQGKQNLFFANTIVIPAEDPFNPPIRVLVNSENPIGKEGNMIDVTANVKPKWRSHEGNWYFSCVLWIN